MIKYNVKCKLLLSDLRDKNQNGTFLSQGVFFILFPIDLESLNV